MKWVFGFLLVLNVALVLWATGHRGPSHPDVAPPLPPVNPASMLLLTEQVRITRAAAGLATCMRVGPFESESNAAKAARTLDELDISYVSRAVRGRRIQAYRVYLGPFDDQSAANQARSMLRARGVKDYYALRQSNGDVVVSLALFSQQSSADSYIKELEAKNVLAKSRPEDQAIAASYWLELRDRRPVGALRAQLRGVDWMEPSATLRHSPCI